MIETNNELMQKAAQSLWNAFDKNHDPGRATVVNVIEGHYGLWGYAIVLNGSPDHGVIILDLSRRLVRYIKYGDIKATARERGYQTKYNHALEFIRKIGYQTEKGKRGIESITIKGVGGIQE